MRLRMLNDAILIKPDEIERHQGKILLPDKNTVEKRSPFATVVSCGSKCNYPFKENQRICYDPFRGSPIYLVLDDVLYRIIVEEDVRFAYES